MCQSKEPVSCLCFVSSHSCLTEVEDLAIAIGEFAHSVGELAESDLNKQLVQAIRHLSEVERKAQDLQHTQAQEDAMTFMATAEEYSRIINSVRVSAPPAGHRVAEC